jgi:hypothetical protein
VNRPGRTAPLGGFNAAFIIGVAGDAYEIDWQAYTGDVSPADLFNGEDNSGPPPFLLAEAADAQIRATGWTRASAWSYTDDIWGCVVEPDGAR